MFQKYSTKEYLHFLSSFVSCTIVLYIIAFSAWTIFYTETGNGDNVEHIHSTWLVAQGKVPYRDFFQHHNPLVWYIFAPIFKMLPNVITMLDVAHAIALVAGFLTFFIVYKICVRFFASNLASTNKSWPFAKPTTKSTVLLCIDDFFVFSISTLSKFNPN